MGWLEDLQHLLTDTDPDPLSDIAQSGPVQGLAVPVLKSAPAQAFFQAMDLGRQASFGAAGQLHAISSGRGFIDWSRAQAEEEQRVAGIQQQEWGPLGVLKTPVELGVNLAMDPTTYTGFGAFGKAARGLEAGAILAGEAGRPIVAGGLRTAAAGARGTQFVFNDVGEKVLVGGRVPAAITRGGEDVLRVPRFLAGRDVGVQPGFRKIRGGIERVSPTAFQVAPEFARRQDEDAISNAYRQFQTAPGGPQMPVAPITSTAAPPIPVHPHPPGSAPAQNYSRGILGWRRLHDPNVGIIPQMQGGDYWKRPADVQLTEAHLADMAAIGVAAMQSVTDEGGIMSSVRRASEGTDLLRRGITEKYGPGVEPYIPLIEDRMRQQLGAKADVMMPSSRYLLPHGWSYGVMKTRRLAAINKDLLGGKITREQALERVGTINKSPQVVEAAAAHGAALLSGFHGEEADLYKQFQPGGAYFPEGLAGRAANAKALIPGQFGRDVWEGTGPLQMDLSQAGQVFGVVQPFGSNREAWDAYMLKQFPGLQPDELQTLSEMSEELLYHSYVNAASPFSGGARGADRIARAAASGQYGEEPAFQTRGGKVADLNRKIALQGSEAEGMLPNFTQIMQTYHRGIDMGVGMGTARNYFPRAAREIAAVVGFGNYEDAQILSHALAITSTATDTSRSAELALRILAEWKFKSDATLREMFGIDGNQFEAQMQGGILRADFTKQQQGSAEHAFNAFAQMREGGMAITADVHRGPKVHQYAGSFLAQLYRDGIREAMGESPLGRRAMEVFDKALSVFAFDRHHSRLDRGAIGVNAIEEFLGRERGLLAARGMGLSPEEAQSAGWLWARDQQGLIHEVGPDGDVASALREAIAKTWNADPDTKQSWDALVDRVALAFKLPRDQAIDQTYDLARQEVFYRLLKSSLNHPDVQEAMRQAGRSFTLEDLKDDALGVMARGANGLYPDEWPHPLRNVQGPGGVVEAMSSLTPNQVMIFDHDSNSWISASTGFGVPIASGKAFRPGQAQTFRKSLEDLLNRGVVSDLFDPSSGVDNTSRVGLGVVQDGNELRPAIFALTDDAATATAGAARTEMGYVHELGSGTATKVPGQGRLRHVPSLLDQISGPATPLAKLTREQVRRRGVTLGERDKTNVVSIFNRKVFNPIMDEFASLDREGIAQAGGVNPGPMTDPTFPEKSLRAMSGVNIDYRLSSNDNAVLNQKLKDGKRYGDFLNIAKRNIAADAESLRNAGVHWPGYTDLKEREALVAHDPKLLKMVRSWHKQGVDIGNAGDPGQAALEALFHQRNIDDGIVRKQQSVFALFKAAWGEQALLSVKYLTGNLQGNWIQNALSGTTTIPTPRDFLSAMQAAQGGSEEVTRAQALASLRSAGIAHGYGTELPEEVLRGGARSVSSNSTRLSPSATGELVGRVAGKKMGRVVGRPLAWWNDFTQSADTVFRSALWGDALKREMTSLIPAWEAEVRKAGSHLPGFEFSVADGINVPSGGLYADPLKAKFMELGITAGESERLTRLYQNILHKGRSAAKKELDRVQFSYDRTNLDVFASHFVPFHYWYSRALRYYGEEAIRHPFLALNYMKAADGIEDAQEDPGLSARQKGFLHLLSSPLGFSLLMNPDSLFGVVKVLGMDDAYEPDGQTSLGGAMMWLKDRGFGLYPWIDGTLNMMGIYGNTFEPDLLGIRHKALVGAAVNFVRAHTGFDPASAPYADAMGQLRYAVSSFVSSFTPDWVSQPVTPRAGGSSQEASLDSIIEATVMANHPGLTNEALLAIMTDPENPEFQHAYQMAADAGVVQQLLNFTLPEQFRMRSDEKDRLAAEQNTIYDAAKAYGVSPYDFVPTTGDLAFKARYKAQTGKDWEPGDYEDANTKYDLLRAPAEAKPFIVDNAAYQKLGTPKQQRRFDRYNNLRYGNDPRTAGLPEDTRKQIALDWAAAHHAEETINQVYDLQDAFETTHPEFAEFKQWQGRVKNLAALYGGSLAEYRRRASAQNPNAARYFADTETFIQATFPQEQWDVMREQMTTSAAAFHAITGKGTNRQNPGPFPGVPPVDLTLPSMEPPAPQYQSTPKPDWVQALAAMNQSQVGPIHS